MKVHHYKTAGGKDLILDYLGKLTKREEADGLLVLEKLADEKLDGLTIKQWRGKILEVYFYGDNRLFYVVADSKDTYILHACRKQKNRTETTDSEKVIKRAKEIGRELSKKFI
jgi:phage-related protein